jgi:hypothetical protein
LLPIFLFSKPASSVSLPPTSSFAQDSFTEPNSLSASHGHGFRS